MRAGCLMCSISWKRIYFEPLWDLARIQGLANDDRVMGGVMMTQNASGPPLRPGQYRLFDLAVKVAPIELREDPFEIVDLTIGRRDYFTTTLSSGDVRCP